jgi:hypothetical protein
MTTIGEICRPEQGQKIRFCTTLSISCELRNHGIDGVYQDGRYWSVGMADHWSPSEVTVWEAKAPSQVAAKFGRSARPQASQTIGNAWLHP